jgi:hypothetical protein
MALSWLFKSCRGKHTFFSLVLAHHNAMCENEFEHDPPKKSEELFCST